MKISQPLVAGSFAQMKLISVIALVCVVILAGAGQAETPSPLTSDLGGIGLQGWTDVTHSTDVGLASLAIPGHCSFRYPDGPRGFFKHGFRTENDSTVDWTPFYGVRFEVHLADAREAEITASAIAATANAPDRIVPASIRIAGAGRHVVMLPWSVFQFDQAGFQFLRFAKGFSIAARFTDGGPPGRMELGHVHLIKAPVVSLECDIRGNAATAGQMAEYQVTVGNCTDQAESVALSFSHDGWEVMSASVQPSAIELAPGQTQTCDVKVQVSDRVPPGGHESQTLMAIANGDAANASRLSFITTSELPHPYLLHTPARWQQVRDKVRDYLWARQALDGYLKTADAWKVPEIAKPPGNDPDDTMGPFLFRTQNENDLLACSFAWQLTGQKRYAQKVAEFLLRLSDPQNGYPKTLRGCNQSTVQEGHFFQHIAMSYDMIRDAGVLSDSDIRQIENTFRIFIESIERLTENGSINNWNLSQDCGAFYCALAMQDLVTADRFFSGPSGIQDQLAKGTMDDGWWYECSISYNMWCASEFTQAAIAYEPFGVDFKHTWVPASYSSTVLLSADLNGGNGIQSPDPQMKGKPFGMDPSIYGPNHRPYRTITDLWDSLLPFIDYRGVMFGVNDSTENKVTGNRTEVSGQPFEIAYFAYGDPRYAALIKMGDGRRDLLYGVPELPEKTPEAFHDNAYADNVGLAMLRSQTPGRPQRDQIQAVLHYGTHGWAHGHFDRTDLLSLMRYGRSFWNPESVFYVYEPFMYKFYTQTSVNHNLVVVDQKMQEARPGNRLLFYTGRLMQVAAVQTTARWSNPPYGGMVYDYVPVKTFAEKTWREGRYVPIPANPPAYGTLTDFTEPILQRRLMIVTDDYVVLADYLKGNKPHTFDNLLSIKGFLDLHAPQKTFLRHDAQWNTDPLGSGQFVTDCNWYSVAAPALARFEERWGPGVNNEGSRSIANEEGSLKLDIHSLWPPSQQIMVATAPEKRDVEKRLYYTVSGDGKTLAEGKFGAWILGRGHVDVPVDGVKHLQLQTRTELSKRPTLFWAGAGIVTKDGKEIPMSRLPIKFDNIVPVKNPGLDYLGGPVKIAGNEYKDTIAAEPKDSKLPGEIDVDLTGIDAARFKCVIGSDYPPGDESNTRKTCAIRATGTEAVFLTLIEPYESASMVHAAAAVDANTIRVELNDGRVQQIAISNMQGDGSNLGVTLTQFSKTQADRTETTAANTLMR